MPVLLTELTDETAPQPESFDGFLLVSFGGPEGPDDVIPFLENVLRGKNVPHERMLEVAEHYKQFGGKSPINDQNRALLGALHQEFQRAEINLPIYWGNRNWTPTIKDALETMRNEGVTNVLAFFTSMFSSYSGCRQYRENIAAAQQEIGDSAPNVVRLRLGFNHPRFIEAMTERVQHSIEQLGGDADIPIRIVFTAHSIPGSMADNCDYVIQLQESAGLIAAKAGQKNWELCYQSRSGPPQVPWLEPDICDRIQSIADDAKQAGKPVDRLIVVPLGFVSDHMEVIYDLDHEAADLCSRLGIVMERAGSAGTHPSFVQMIGELVKERIKPGTERPTLGDLPACADVCALDCCTYQPRRPPRR